MKAEYINPFVNCTMNVFKTMLDMKPVKGKLRLKEDNKTQHDISGIIGLSGKASGTVVLCFEKKVAFKVVEGLLKSPVNDINSDVTDAIGEMANMVAGRAKVELNKFGFDISISVPSVIIGNHSVASPRDIPTIIIPFTCEHGEFSVEVSLKTPK